MRVFRYFIFAAAVCWAAGCSSEPVRVLAVRDIHGGVIASKTLRFAHSRESWIPGADVPLFGPATVIVEVPLDTNGQAQVQLRETSWWVSFDVDSSRAGHSVLSLAPSDVRHGGTFRFYKPPPTIGDTNVFLSDYILTIKKP